MNTAVRNNNTKLSLLFKKGFKHFWRDRYLLLFLMPAVVFLFIFNYIPMYGIVIAFQNYHLGSPFLAFDGSIQWVGLENFIKFFNSIFFIRVMKNAILNSFFGIAFGFWIPIIFALLLNEIHHRYYKKFVQTASYLPYFISTPIVAGIVINILAKNDGVLNVLLNKLGMQSVDFLGNPGYFRCIYVVTIIWQTFGWSTVLYMASIANIDINLYEAAFIDGANRWRQVIHITLPSILPTIVICLIFNLGSILNSNTELILLLYNPTIYDTADVLGTYVYRSGIQMSQFSYASAVGLFSTVVNFLFLNISNNISKKLTDYGLW